MIKALIFDYFDVLVDDVYWRQVLAKAKADGTMDIVDRAQVELNTGRSGMDAFWQTIGDLMGVAPEYVFEQYSSLPVNNELAAYIKELKSTHKIVLLSNAERTQVIPQLEKNNLSQLFDEIIISSDLGFIKPDVRIFATAADRLGVQTHECVMIDDNPDNITGAKAAGLAALLFTDNAKLKSDLGALLT